MTRAEFVAELGRLIVARRMAAGQDRAEVLISGDHATSDLPLRMVAEAIDADLGEDMKALGRVRSLARQLMAEEESE